MKDQLIQRRKTKTIYVGNVPIGSGYPIVIQSMTNTDTRNINKTVEQIKALENHGCQIVRVAVPDEKAAEALKNIKKLIKVPLIADIHFNYKLALEAIKNDVDGLRVNPGNIGSNNKVQEIVKACKEKNIPIRIGVNAGSLEKELLEKYKGVTHEAIVESALKHINILEKLNYDNIKISLKASNVVLTLKSYQLLAEKVDYPFHIGITEAGTVKSGVIKSAVGIGALLAIGLGDTIRVSLTGSPLEEIPVAKGILQSLNLYDAPELISCPTCGRCDINLTEIALKVEEILHNLKKPVKVAVMGCVVNGPGEAKDADIGIAG
ncbi:MAG: flavodoxin-dependent (E)-4-hydroxy-3-methylbut-2-enyl-diphosphate synthase, partial [Bacillota bacterium]|nr:flavodoxin-dependent (E)-4-hydroxy-3-methylbut-2-enyl-diphosphate synthase [Bacillota bacterium]